MTDELFDDLNRRGFFEIVMDDEKWDAWQKQNASTPLRPILIYPTVCQCKDDWTDGTGICQQCLLVRQ